MYDLLNTGLVFTQSENENDTPITTNYVISEYARIKVHAVNQLIRRYKSEMKSLGLNAREVPKVIEKNTNGRPKITYLLNEKQSVFIIALLRNTKQVVEFKRNLANAFVEVKKLLSKRQITHSNSKPITKTLGQAIQDNPNITNKFAYSTFNKLIYKHALGINTNQLRKTKGIPKHDVISDYLTVDEQQELNKIKNLVISLLNINLDYQTIKQTLENLPSKQLQGSK
ncbi:hypothetical protein DY120_01870 [Apilactobacillus micheneri]|uniref:Uncharacterized protein n=1 Tax=Apilactobacillus micheneri TaxID=1899430 RepID=A0ABY2YYW0_9LACO|nr:Rha family transcriptional regulator [Apilactobacillus micheneri]TPR26466.1 hypothetical protein DY114_01870 [Apilactobacillus micheneri]TPR27220.1 hypothetical protein DY111_01870 [Apilactobacillus micheneri]TPR27467.1 hypothetical protein DY113_06820 [Apilactobacillus micheneri]TPR31983.1 hypothetical protein DY117_01870 [Apilactobacillus micheneri]TPR32387.1 hypothetical protein DY120_01870 [Apilactobacillus micheneri]